MAIFFKIKSKTFYIFVHTPNKTNQPKFLQVTKIVYFSFMAKAKFYYDPESLSYKPIKRNSKKKISITILYIFASLIMSVIGFFGFSAVLKSPSERAKIREIENLKTQYQLLDQRIYQASEVLSEIEMRDNNIYRVYFEAKPISDTVRRAIPKNIKKYQYLEGYNTSEMIIEASKKLDILSKRMVVQSQSLDEIVQLAKNKNQMLASIPAIQPVANKDLRHMASGYGMRIHPIYKTPRMHWGMDFSAPRGTKIYATGNGTVKVAKDEGGGYGKNVIINHGYGYETLYGHLSKFNVRPGQSVKRGDLIGFVGSSGTSTSPHLHYEVKKGSQKLNPVYFYHNDLSPAQYERMLHLSSQENQSLD